MGLNKMKFDNSEAYFTYFHFIYLFHLVLKLKKK